MPSGIYTATPLSTAIAAVAARLDDRSQIRWTAPELQTYIQMALRTWNALTAAFRDTLTFNVNVNGSNAPFYDLNVIAPGLRGLTLTTDDALHVLEYHLLEAQSTGSVWSGTNQFTYQDLLQALERRRDQFLLETAAVCQRTSISIAPPPDGRIPLPEQVVTLRRLAWTTPDAVVTPLQREDEWSANAYRTDWVQHPQRTPRVYSLAVEQPLYVQLIPPPNDTGFIDLAYVARGATLGPGVALGVPNDWAWVVIFGALADLLNRDGLALDPARANYAQMRWTHGLLLAQAAPVVLTARIDDRICRVCALPDLDQFRRSWQTTQGRPTVIGTLGQNLLVASPPPDANAPSGYSITLDVVCNAPVPLLPSQPLQIGPELLDTIYDYAQHLALFKEGPTELQASNALLDRFFRAANVYDQWQQALIHQRKALLGQQSQDRRGTAPLHRPTEEPQQPSAPGVTL